MNKLILFSILLLAHINIFSQHKILESNENQITLSIDFTNRYSVIDTLIEGRTFTKISGNYSSFQKFGEPWLPGYMVSAALPHNADVTIQILNIEDYQHTNKFVLPFPKEDPEFTPLKIENLNEEVYSTNKFFPELPAELGYEYTYRFARIGQFYFYPYQFNPVTRELREIKKMTVRILINNSNNNNFIVSNVYDPHTENILSSVVINPEQGVQWVAKTESLSESLRSDDYWYKPNKEYIKIYTHQKGVHRVTYEQLLNAGANISSGVPIEKLELFANENQVPIDVVDIDEDSIFNNGDFIQFVAFPPPSGQFTKSNIYNRHNIYWFSTEGDTSSLRYLTTPGMSFNYIRSIKEQEKIDFYEIDSIYEQLGYAPNDNRDYWYWGSAIGNNGNYTSQFVTYFENFKAFDVENRYVRLRVNMHGITTAACNYGHKADIFINDKLVGTALWNGQTEYTFETNFYVSNDSVQIFPEGNVIRIAADGNICHPSNSDVIRINWFDFKYASNNRVAGNNYLLRSPLGLNGINLYWLWEWQSDSMKIYIPSKNKVLENPLFLNDFDKTVYFVDTTLTQTEYFVVGDDFYITPDSLVKEINTNYRASSNAADYIIITHPKFKSIAEQLANYRQNNFPDPLINNPRIFIADIFDIYDEFSGGLLDPYAVRDFIKHAFENWQSPAPAHVVLIGDMSRDYRKLLTNSRLNYIPSIPLRVFQYGQTISDNLLVAVAGNDILPDLTIGRISIETVEEGEVFLNKLINYPADNSKKWKQNFLLLSSGLNLDDENRFRFNDENVRLDTLYLQKIGLNSKKIFRYPTRDEHQIYRGEGPEIRRGFNEGAVVANYYGHGGGYQWDLVFLNDDIYLLENQFKLPLILSVTCYTAHFDNQKVFAEQFVLVPNKGAIGFFGSSGLTNWDAGKFVNHRLFQEMINNRNYLTGKVFQTAKMNTPAVHSYGEQINLLTYIGEPLLELALPKKPDFEIRTNSFSVDNPNPLVNEVVNIKLKITNYGLNFPNDSVTVQFYKNSIDTSNLISSVKVPSFNLQDSVIINWIPEEGGLVTIYAVVNGDNLIDEDDHIDNIASFSLPVFNISDPNIYAPQNGLTTSSNSIEFLLSDIGYYIDRQLQYVFHFDTSFNFNSSALDSIIVNPSEGVVRFNKTFPSGIYFWRTRIIDGENLARWSNVRTFRTGSENLSGFSIKEKQLATLQTYNLNYNPTQGVLQLNTDLLPPRPAQNRFIENIDMNNSLFDSLIVTTIDTDGRYIYFSSNWYYAYNYDSLGRAKIYRVGTGNGGTTKGLIEEVTGFHKLIRNSIFYHNDGYLYVALGDSASLFRINVNNFSDTSYVSIPDGLIRWEDATTNKGSYYLKSDGQYVYNLAIRDEEGAYKYTLKIFDPANNWSVVEQKVLSGSSYPGFTDFFVAHGYLYPTENYESGFIRRIRISDNFYDEEWLSATPFRNFYGWCYDRFNDNVYAAVFNVSFNYLPSIAKFVGRYIDAVGNVATDQIGPAFKWNSVNYDFENNSSSGNFEATLVGYNRKTNQVDTLINNLQPSTSLTQFNNGNYQYLKLYFNLVDSSLGSNEPMKLKSIHFDYTNPPEISVSKEDFSFTPDSLLQGYNITMNLKVKNIGETEADSVNIKFYLNNADSTFYNPIVSVPKDTFIIVSTEIPTSALLFNQSVQVIANTTDLELFTYNNISSNTFFVARDSIKPLFKITFDGQEIINGDIISSRPNVEMRLTDNSPLLLDTANFTIVHIYQNRYNQIRFNNSALEYSIAEYPNSEVVINWKPTLGNGRHVLEVLAKDASGNFFDTTVNRSIFNVFDKDDIVNVYPYPNPFANETYFTFQLLGSNIPEELNIKIFTVAGRLIKEIEVPVSELQIGFNRIFWDGKDEDGDDIANGVYFYKVITKTNGVTKILTEKMARVR